VDAALDVRDARDIWAARLDERPPPQQRAADHGPACEDRRTPPERGGVAVHTAAKAASLLLG
jgi:hypothetical protein